MCKRYFQSIFLVLYVGFAPGSSLTPATESSAQSMSVLRLVTGAIKAVGLGNVGAAEHFIRRAAHPSEHMLLEALPTQRPAQYGPLAATKQQLHGLTGFLIPFVDEMPQLSIKGYSGQINDVWLDCAGVLFGTALSLAVGR